MTHIPPLNHWCNSWIVTRRDNGEVVGEFYNRATVERFDPAKVIVENASDYLCRLNASIAANAIN